MHFAFGIPFYFVSKKFTIYFLNIINFLLLGCSPKICIGKYIIVIQMLKPFAYYKIFPQLPNILPEGQCLQLGNSRISNTIIG